MFVYSIGALFMKKNLLAFHPIIAPYRIDLFNSLAKHYNSQICLFWRNLKDQTFDYRKIEEQFDFKPSYPKIRNYHPIHD